MKVIKGRTGGIKLTMSIGTIGCFLSAIFSAVAISKENETFAEVERAFAIIGKLGVAGTFAIIYVHTSELYPTSLRSIGVGMSSAAGYAGGVLAPIVISSTSIAWIPMTVFGLFGVGLVIVTFWLPDTNNMQMLTTLFQAERFYETGKSNKVEDQVESKIRKENSTTEVEL